MYSRRITVCADNFKICKTRCAGTCIFEDHVFSRPQQQVITAVYIHKCMYTHVCTHTCIHSLVCTHIYMHTHVCTHIYVHKCMYTHVCTHMYVHTCMYTRVSKHIYAHTHGRLLKMHDEST